MATCCEMVTASSARTSAGDSAEHTARCRTEQCRQSSVVHPAVAGELDSTGSVEDRDIRTATGTGAFHDTPCPRGLLAPRASSAQIHPGARRHRLHRDGSLMRDLAQPTQ